MAPGETHQQLVFKANEKAGCAWIALLSGGPSRAVEEAKKRTQQLIPGPSSLASMTKCDDQHGRRRPKCECAFELKLLVSKDLWCYVRWRGMSKAAVSVAIAVIAKRTPHDRDPFTPADENVHDQPGPMTGCRSRPRRGRVKQPARLVGNCWQPAPPTESKPPSI